MRAGGRIRPIGFLLLMVGFGLRLDTPWPALGLGVAIVGGLLAAAGLMQLARAPGAAEASVPRRGGG